ncbi:hypothetical protein [Streptomyces sp. NPDC091217]|uniref:hypothetical protein n=1 Tax=Streptomyces sp. NPDC091217 TaxID=3365975 RepID=UPI003803CF8B
MDATTWAQFNRPEQFYEVLAKIGDERRKLREAETRLKAETESVAVRALQLGVPREKVAELTGYSSGTLEKWEGTAAARRAHAIKQQLRDEARVKAREKRRKEQLAIKRSTATRKRK